MVCNLTVIWTVSLILLLFIIWLSSITCVTKDVLGSVRNGYIATSLVGDTALRDLLKKRIKYVECRRSILTPVNSAVLNKLKPMVDSLTIMNIPSWLELLPGNKLGFLPLEPIECADSGILFQFEQGRLGWYWFYMTFPEQNASVMFYLNRVELLPPCVRKKQGLKLGQSTIYQVSAGVGVNGKWNRTSYYVNSGIYQIFDQGSFKFNTIDNMFVFSQAGTNMNLQINAPMTSIDDNTTHAVILNLSISTTKPMYFNGAFAVGNSSKDFTPSRACVPCLFGDGSLYMSYTDLSGSGTLGIDSTSTSLANGVGWMDNQFGGSEYNSVLGKLLMNIFNRGAITTTLPKYVWINLHISSNLQYMIYTFPTTNPKTGVTLSAVFNRYTPDNNTVFFQKCNIEPTATAKYEGVDYVTKINVTLDGETYMLDTTPYGMQITIDINNAAHFDGCGNLYNAKNPSVRIGTGFMELQRLLGDDEFYSGLWSAAGIKDASSLINWYPKQKDTSAFVFALVVVIISLILTVFLFYKLGSNLAGKY